MAPNVIVCNGCCCGNLEKGHDKVPIDLIEREWKSHGLNENVTLKISGCLGPCSRRNVAILDTLEGPIWLGGLSGEGHYRGIVDWALDYTTNGSDSSLSETLQQLIFERTQNFKIQEPRRNF